MNGFSNSKGITIVSLVVVILLLLILSGVGFNLGTNGIKSVNDSKLKAELDMVQHAVLEQYTKYKTTKDETYLLGSKISDDEINTLASELNINLVSIPNTYSNKEYYKLDNRTLATIGIQDSTDEYIVNYVSGEVINITTKRLSNNTPLYTKADSF